MRKDGIQTRKRKPKNAGGNNSNAASSASATTNSATGANGGKSGTSRNDDLKLMDGKLTWINTVLT